MSDQRVRWAVGEVVGDLYEVREVIESGGMGLVHRVHHRGWNMDLSVKTPRPELVSSPQQVVDFETEAETWVGLGLHPNVVACVYVRRLDGLPRVFAEWIDGGSLHDAIESGELYEGSHDDVLARILDVAIQFAWGLDYAHSQGLVHQDVKPANLMLAADWTAKVSDFGLAKARTAAGEITSSATGVSVLAAFGGGMTPGYCSPEQASAYHIAKSGGHPDALSRATDVWSWAISVWEMFTGEAPVERGQAAAEAFEAFREDSSVDDPAIPELPEIVRELLSRCLDPDPATRPRRMDELADELAELYQRLVGVPYPRTKPEPAKLVADGLNNQALSLLDLGRIEQAEHLWQQALSTDPHHLHTVYNYGLHRWRRGESTDFDLISALEAARSSHPGAESDRRLAQVHLERRDTATACTLLTQASAAAPRDRDIAAALTAAESQSELAEPRTLIGHSKSVWSVALSGDGRIAASGSWDHTVRLWDLTSGACLHTLAGHTDSVEAVALSADGRIAVSGSRDDTVRVWDVQTGAYLRNLAGHTRYVHSVALSADGQTAAATTTLHVWDVTTGACLHSPSGYTGLGQTVALSADGHVAVSDGLVGSVRVWDLSTGQGQDKMTAHTGSVTSVALTADGRVAVSGSDDTAVRVWDVRAGDCLRTLRGHTGEVTSVAVSADGRIAVSGSKDKTVRVWDVLTGRCLRTLTDHSYYLTSVAVSADGRVAVSADSFDKTVWVWEVPTTPGLRAEWSYLRPQSAQALIGAAADVERAARRAEALLARADGSGAAAQLRIARGIAGHSRHPRLVALWRQLAMLGHPSGLRDAWTQRSFTGHTDDVASVAISADGRIVLSGGKDETVRVWDVRTGQCLHTLTHGDIVASVAISANGHIAVSGGWDRAVRVWDLTTGRCQHTLARHRDDVTSVALSADGRTAVSGSVDRTVRVWNVPAGQCQQTLAGGGFKLTRKRGHTGEVTSVALSADGRTAVSGSEDKTMRVWDVPSGECRYTLKGEGDIPADLVAISADGHTAVSTNYDAVQVWDLLAGDCLHTMSQAPHVVNSVALSADGRIALSGGEDATVRVWNATTGDCLRILSGQTDAVKAVALSADATVAAVLEGSTTMRVWALDWEYEFPNTES
jgi:WD40 repeat protein/serine/threonine protein kinase